jgi:hypothetical protein
MYEAVLIKPEYLRQRGKRIIRCTFSGLKYTVKDYQILYDAKKLAYFEFSSFKKTKPIVCHEVLYKYVCALAGNPKERILNIKDGKTLKKCKVDCQGKMDLEELKGMFGE